MVTKQYLEVLVCKEVLLSAEEHKKISAEELVRLEKLYQSSMRSKKELLEMKAVCSMDEKEFVTAQNNLANSLINLKALLDIDDIENFDVESIAVGEFIEKDIVLLRDIAPAITSKDPLLTSAQLRIDMAEKEIKVARAGFLPSLNFNYMFTTSYYHVLGSEDLVFNSQTGQYENNGFLTQLRNNKIHYMALTLSIPVFGQYQNKVNTQKATIAKEEAVINYKNQKKDLLNFLNKTVNDYLTAKSEYKTSLDALTYQQEAFAIAKHKYDEGYLSLYDFLESKDLYIDNQLGVIVSKYNYYLKEKMLEFYLTSY